MIQTAKPTKQVETKPMGKTTVRNEGGRGYRRVENSPVHINRDGVRRPPKLNSMYHEAIRNEMKEEKACGQILRLVDNSLYPQLRTAPERTGKRRAGRNNPRKNSGKKPSPFWLDRKNDRYEIRVLPSAKPLDDPLAQEIYRVLLEGDPGPEIKKPKWRGWMDSALMEGGPLPAVRTARGSGFLAGCDFAWMICLEGRKNPLSARKNRRSKKNK